MAKLRHLALWTRQPEKMAEFYTRVFEMKELYRTKNGAIHLSDGEVNLALLNANNPKDPDDHVRVGMNHFGFHIDDQETTVRLVNHTQIRTAGWCHHLPPILLHGYPGIITMKSLPII